MKSNQYTILVAEPWDFVGPHDRNINGRIVKFISLSCIVFKSNDIIHFKNDSGDTLCFTS
jgi:hypothetical protein